MFAFGSRSVVSQYNSISVMIKNVLAIQPSSQLAAHSFARRSSSCAFPGPPNAPEPGIYRHYQTGDLYKVLGSVMHTESSETLVLYEAFKVSEKARQKNPHQMAFARPMDMFMSNVEQDGKQIPRFQRVHNDA